MNRVKVSATGGSYLPVTHTHSNVISNTMGNARWMDRAACIEGD